MPRVRLVWARIWEVLANPNLNPNPNPNPNPDPDPTPKPKPKPKPKPNPNPNPNQVLGEFFIEVGQNENLSIALYAVDSLRQVRG